MGRLAIKQTLFLLCCISLLLCSNPIAFAQSDEEKEILRLFYEKEDLVVVSATRNEKPISQVAENITVITAEDIEEMNAHTLTDVLNIITGVQMEIKGGVGSVTHPHIQGSDYRHVLVLIDGVSLNNLSDNFADIGAITVQHIDMIEIIKGPASSAWGSSLGGVINIITKSAGNSLMPVGTISTSYGEGNTGDYRAEVYGKAGIIGYYLSAGRLQSDGFSPNMSALNDNFYTKLNMDITKKVELQFTLGYNKGGRGFGEFPDYDLIFDNDFEYLFSTLSLNTSFNDKADLSISLRTSTQDTEFLQTQYSTGQEMDKQTYGDENTGGSLKLDLKHGKHLIVIGSDYDNSKYNSNTMTSGTKRLEKWAVFTNDTISFNNLSITPGIRYDNISTTSDDFISPSLGGTYALGKKSLIRIAVARGFNIPPITARYGKGFFYNPNPDLKVEKVWSYQVGFETGILKYIWLKTTGFKYDINDAIDKKQEQVSTINKAKIRIQGVAVEIETLPLYNTSLYGGYILQDKRNLETDEVIKDISKYTIDIGLKYNDKKSLKGLLTGHYVWWNAEPINNGEYSSFIWDLNVSKKVYTHKHRSADIFLTAHNLFNDSQYLDELYKNPRRWIEAGVRIKF